MVRRIPRGRVASYGQVAAEAGLPNAARQVGYALHALPDGSAVPWHRGGQCAGGHQPPEPSCADATDAADPRGGPIQRAGAGGAGAIRLEATPTATMMISPAPSCSLAAWQRWAGSALSAQGAEADNFGFLLAERTPLGGANAGVMYRYQRVDGVGVDLFVTPLPPSLDPCREACADSALAILSAEFTQAVVDAGAPDSLRLAGSTVVAPPEGSWLEGGRSHGHPCPCGQHRGRFLSLALPRAGDAGPGAWPAPGGRNRLRDAEPAVSALVASVPPTYDCPDGLSNVSAQMKLVPLDFQMTRLRAWWIRR